MKKLILIPLIFLASCAGPPKNDLETLTGETVTEIEIRLEDGRILECLRFEDGAGDSRVGSIDCNWNNPTNELR